MLKKLDKDIIIFPALWILVVSLTRSTNELLKYNPICYLNYFLFLNDNTENDEVLNRYLILSR